MYFNEDNFNEMTISSPLTKLISMKSIETISYRQRQRRQVTRNKNSVIAVYNILFILIVLLYCLYPSYFIVVYSFPTGAGSCIGNSNGNNIVVSAIGGPHLTATTVTELQSWEDKQRDIQVFIGSYSYSPEYNTTIPLLTDIEYTIYIIQNPAANINNSFKGFLIRLENLDNDNYNNTYTLASELQLIRRDMEQQQIAETCRLLPNVIGITHTNAIRKTNVAIGIRSNQTMIVSVDITLVFEANSNSSIYAHGKYIVSFISKPTTESSTQPTTTPSATVPKSTSPTVVVIPSTGNNSNPMAFNIPTITPNTDALAPLLVSPRKLPSTQIFFPIALSPKSRQPPTNTNPVNPSTDLKRDQNNEFEMKQSVDLQLPVLVQELKNMKRNSGKSRHSLKSKDSRKKNSKMKVKAIRISSKSIRNKSTMNNVSSKKKSMKEKQKGHGEKGKKMKMGSSKKMRNR